MSARLRALLALPVLLATLVAGVLTSTVAGAPAADAATKAHHHTTAKARVAHKVHHARKIALRQIGSPYRYGAAGPHRFDCSGLVYYSFRHAGLGVPRTSSAQAAHARHIPRKRMHPGDLMFFHNGGGVYHVAIFLKRSHGRVVMLHSPRPGQHVQRAHPWTGSWFAGTMRRR